MELPTWVSNFCLRDAFKGYTLELDKIIEPAKTVEFAKAKLSLFGDKVLKGTIRIDSGRLGIPVYMSLCGLEAERIIGTKKQMGKGCSPEQAEASALMELVERFSLFRFIQDPKNFLYGSFYDFSKEALPLQELARSVGDLNPPQIILDTFSELQTRWVWAYSLTSERPSLLPFDWFWMINEYNGSSAGNTKEEAILQGICEVVERHVSALVSNQKIPVPKLKISYCHDTQAQKLLDKFTEVGICLWLSDFSLDTGIPTVGALAYDPSTYPNRSEIVWTAGTTTSPSKSLIRALTEVAQLAGDFDTSLRYIPSGLPKPSSLVELHYITEAKLEKELMSLPDISDENMKVEIERALECLKGIHMNVYVVDITHAGIGIPACYTIIPGAHFRERTQGKMGRFVLRLLSESLPPEEAFHRLQGMKNDLSKEHYIYFYLGEALRQLKRYDEAIENYEIAYDLSPIKYDQMLSLTYKSVALNEMGEYKKAIDSLNQALDLDSNSPELYNLLGNCQYKLGDYGGAINSFLKALDMNPGSAIDYANVATNYLKLGNIEEAINYYQMALRIDPDLDYAKIRLQEISNGGTKSFSEAKELTK